MYRHAAGSRGAETYRHCGEQAQLLTQMGRNKSIQSPFSPHSGVFETLLCLTHAFQKHTFRKQHARLNSHETHFSDFPRHCRCSGDNSRGRWGRTEHIPLMELRRKSHPRMFFPSHRTRGLTPVMGTAHRPVGRLGPTCSSILGTLHKTFPSAY